MCCMCFLAFLLSTVMAFAWRWVVSERFKEGLALIGDPTREPCFSLNICENCHVQLVVTLPQA